jgi:hypothetical protein
MIYQEDAASDWRLHRTLCKGLDCPSIDGHSWQATGYVDSASASDSDRHSWQATGYCVPQTNWAE